MDLLEEVRFGPISVSLHVVDDGADRCTNRLVDRRTNGTRHRRHDERVELLLVTKVGRFARLTERLIDRLAFRSQVLHELLPSARRQTRVVGMIQREVGEIFGSTNC